MRTSVFSIIVLTSALLLPIAAHADPIDDFVLTGGGHTISYSLPATSSYPDFSLFNFFYESAPATIDGVSGYQVGGAYYVPGLVPRTLVLYVPDTIFGTSMLSLTGSSFFSLAFVPASNPLPYMPYDVVPTFIPGTYALQDVGTILQPLLPPVPYTLTITQETATTPTPEPSSLILLATGIFGLIGFAAIKHRNIVSSH